MTLFEFISELVGIPTVVGFERCGIHPIGKLCTEYSAGFFDSYSLTPTGSLLFSRLCGKKNAKKLVLDAHIDTIGFAVSELCGNGFVKVKSMGGIDPYVLPSAPLYLYGKQPVYGVFSSIPPHLAQKDAKKLEVSDLYVDTGLSDEQMKQDEIEIGTPCGYAEPPVLLQNRTLASHSLDDKACAATILHACRLLAQSGREPADTDIFVHLSVGEEKTGIGARTLPYTALENGFVFSEADAALVMDVNFAHAPGVHDYESLALGKGAGVSYSATIKRAFTDFIVQTTGKYEIPLQTVVEMCSTGTNAGTLHRNGLPCAVLSLPETNMHTYSECVSLDDMETCAALVGEIMRDFPTANLGEVRFK